MVTWSPQFLVTAKRRNSGFQKLFIISTSSCHWKKKFGIDIELFFFFYSNIESGFCKGIVNVSGLSDFMNTTQFLVIWGCKKMHGQLTSFSVMLEPVKHRTLLHLSVTDLNRNKSSSFVISNLSQMWRTIVIMINLLMFLHYGNNYTNGKDD